MGGAIGDLAKSATLKPATKENYPKVRSICPLVVAVSRSSFRRARQGSARLREILRVQLSFWSPEFVRPRVVYPPEDRAVAHSPLRCAPVSAPFIALVLRSMAPATGCVPSLPLCTRSLLLDYRLCSSAACFHAFASSCFPLLLKVRVSRDFFTPRAARAVRSPTPSAPRRALFLQGAFRECPGATKRRLGTPG